MKLFVEFKSRAIDSFGFYSTKKEFYFCVSMTQTNDAWKFLEAFIIVLFFFSFVDFICPCISLFINRYVMMTIGEKKSPFSPFNKYDVPVPLLSRVQLSSYISLSFYALLALYDVDRDVHYFILLIVVSKGENADEKKK